MVTYYKWLDGIAAVFFKVSRFIIDHGLVLMADLGKYSFILVLHFARGHRSLAQFIENFTFLPTRAIDSIQPPHLHAEKGHNSMQIPSCSSLGYSCSLEPVIGEFYSL